MNLRPKISAATVVENSPYAGALDAESPKSKIKKKTKCHEI